MNFWNGKKILLTGGAGFLGSSIYEKLLKRGVPSKNIRIPRSKEFDLRVWQNCLKAVKNIDIVIHLAARVGGIGFNQKYPGMLLYDNAIMGLQLMEAARLEGVQKFVAIGTICAYPKFAIVPFKEEDLWNGYPEETNAPYGLAKKIILVQSQAYRQQYDFNSIFLLPVNLYGPGDYFHLENSHVIPAIIKKMIDARNKGEKKIILWGTGESSREFLYVEDAAEGTILASEKFNKSEPINLGNGNEIKIKDLVSLLAELISYQNEIIWDESKPDGQPRRCLDVSKAEMEFGFKAKTDFKEGLLKTIQWYENTVKEG